MKFWKKINNNMKLTDIHESFNKIFDGYGWRDEQYQKRRKPKPVKEETNEKKLPKK